MVSERFVNRAAEVRDLLALSEHPESRLAILYGRRRIGKTFLLDHVWPGAQQFYFVAAESTAELNRQDLLRELGAWSGRNLSPEDFPTWRTIFREIVSIARERPIVVVLDEFQYLMAQPDDVASQLNAVWDRELQGAHLTLVLSGSAVATMESLIRANAPLYGRTAWAAQIRAFDYLHAAEMVLTPNRSHRDLALFYGIFGGVPKYLAAVTEGESLDVATSRAMLSETGEVSLQLATLIEQEKGIRTPAEYRAVLTAIATGATTVNEIAQAAGMSEQPAEVRRVLAVLEQLELVRKERNFDAAATAPYWYRIADNAIRFWYEFVERNRSRVVRQDPSEIWRSIVAPRLNDYMGQVFEGICREAYLRQHGRWGLPMPVGPIGRWEGQDRNRTSTEVDFIARVERNRVLVGEVKWWSDPVDAGVHNALIDKLTRLSHSGQGWATAALSQRTSAGFIYFAASGFTESTQRVAAENPNVHLIDLPAIYAPLAA